MKQFFAGMLVKVRVLLALAAVGLITGFVADLQGSDLSVFGPYTIFAAAMVQFIAAYATPERLDVLRRYISGKARQ